MLTSTLRMTALWVLFRWLTPPRVQGAYSRVPFSPQFAQGSPPKCLIGEIGIAGTCTHKHAHKTAHR